MSIRVKICGLSTPETVAAAVEEGAAYLGFVFFERSPRHVGFETARALALDVPPGVAKVALTVNAEDGFLDALTGAVPLDMLQLHGGETPERVAEVKARFGLPVMKAVGVGSAEDVGRISDFEAVADQILVDAKPPKGADRPGGNAVAFDWGLIAGRRWATPWMLSGGLTAETAMAAVRVTGANQLDLSSGVETAPGVKDAALIRDFLRAVR
ncbi:MAG: phosphoribosylanthranilate isomerase [Paracoccaceae bacterium]|nr:phosphoribosylanthranilate isomerase [Paracoccaceae bacterium]